jgi:hypothetical protein
MRLGKSSCKAVARARSDEVRAFSLGLARNSGAFHLSQFVQHFVSVCGP